MAMPLSLPFTKKKKKSHLLLQQQQNQSSSSDDCYTPIPCRHDENYIVLPSFLHHLIVRFATKRTLVIVGLIFLFISAVYFFWPSDPAIKIVRMHLNKIHIHALPIISIDVSLQVTIKVSNVDVYSMDFTALDIALRYRGKKLGHVKSGKGHVRARASSYVDAELEFSKVGVLSDVVFLLEDLARGKVPFDTVTKFDGKLGFLFFEIPMKARMTCEILINTINQTIFRQNCGSD
ncbi:uncharacterized protein LOC126679959 [Mercurialis annua]|uniref:uncharacterized protein LOC126679959 n=1 Tax=Mercurialis annua TaxID=3986 RepID=UPI0021606FF9|nr:uncharacterized protein LOC126679959 [Mercurialis annua]